MATEIKNNPKQKEGYAEFRKNVSKGLKLQLPVTAKQEIKELEKMADTIERLRKKMADLDRTRGQITSTIAEIERAIDKNYIPMEKVGPRGERFYYIKLMEEDSKYHVMVLDRAKLLLKRFTLIGQARPHPRLPNATFLYPDVFYFFKESRVREASGKAERNS